MLYTKTIATDVLKANGKIDEDRIRELFFVYPWDDDLATAHCNAQMSNDRRAAAIAGAEQISRFIKRYGRTDVND